MIALGALVLAGVAAAEPWTPSAGYLGEFISHPGVFVAAERSLAAGAHHALAAGGRAGAYHHPRHHTGLLLTAEAGYRLTASVGLYGEVVLGVGVHHRVLAGPVYVERDGEVTATRDLGRPSLLTTLGLGAGWDLGRRTDWPMRVFARLEGWGRYPVNQRVLPDLALSAGAAWTLGGA